LAESFQNEKDYSRALDFYTKAIKLDSLNAIRYYYRSWLLSEYINDNNNAIKDIDKAIKLDKNDPRWFLMQAKVFERMNNNSKALNAYNESIKLSNNSAEFVSERGKFYFKIGEESKALLDIDNAVKKDSLFKKSYYYKAEILIGQNKQLEAINMLKKVSEKFENDTISNKLIGDIYLSAKNYNNALHYYMKAASAINGNKGYMMVDPNECLIFGSDVCSKIAEIYKMLGEIDLMCEYKNMALKSLKNELRPKKDEIEGKLNSFFLNCTNSK
jgi:tetratricopeptide (TPR) repeat protein